MELRPNDQLGWSSLSLFYVRNEQIKEAEDRRREGAHPLVGRQGREG